MRIELELRSPGNLLIDFGKLCISDLFSLPPKEVEKQTVLVGNRKFVLGDHFKIACFDADKNSLLLCGETRRIISAGRQMESGHLMIEGDAGPYTGAEMSGGELEVSGNAGDCLGEAMRGGVLRVHGNAGDWCGSAQPGQSKGMTGGTIVVDGSIGDEAGAEMRRGLLVAGGNSGKYPGLGMLAGTIICLGQLGAGAGMEMKRGSIVTGCASELLPGFYPAGDANYEWLRIYLAWLQRYWLSDLQAWKQRSTRCFTGDHLVSGKGEILVYDFLE